MQNKNVSLMAKKTLFHTGIFNDYTVCITVTKGQKIRESILHKCKIDVKKYLKFTGNI